MSKPSAPTHTAEQEREFSFAQHFSSPSFAIHVGSVPHTRQTYHLPRLLLAAHSHYLFTLLNSPFHGIEATNNVVTLDMEVDRVDAFDAFVDWMFHADYKPPKSLAQPERICVFHAQVYVFAERLCADGLKAVALAKLRATLLNEYHPKTNLPTLSSSAILALVKAVYPHTRDVPADDDGTAFIDQPPSAKGKEKEKRQNKGKASWDVDSAPAPEPEQLPKNVARNIQAGFGLTHRQVETGPDPARMLVARYAASALDTLRADTEFSRLMRQQEGCAEFGVDVLLWTKKGDPLWIKKGDPLKAEGTEAPSNYSSWTRQRTDGMWIAREDWE